MIIHTSKFNLGYVFYSIYSNIRLTGRWLEERGFEPESNYYELAFNDFLILCPEKFPEHREVNVGRKCE